MQKNELDILSKELEIPENVQEAVATALSGLQNDHTASLENNSAKHFKLPKAAAVVILACLLIPGVTVAAAAATKILNSYWQRMDALDKEDVEHIYKMLHNAETMQFSRDLTEEEQERMPALREKFKAGEIVPNAELKILAENETYSGESIAFEEESYTMYLPDTPLTDDELLLIIEYDEMAIYSVRIMNEVGYGTEWRARMEKMTSEEVDEFYFIHCSNKGTATSHGYRNRLLSGSEEKRYQELQTEYEENGMYTTAECTIFENMVDYPGEALAFCIQDGNYYLPERELTDDELLWLIEQNHKMMYCFERISLEIDMGIRSGWPQTPYDLEPVNE